jgi:hypothetical protein
MTDFTRVTVVGASRKAELVVPNDESIGALIPQLMDLLEEPAGTVSRPLTLVRSTGEQLDLSLSPAQQFVRDGELLRLLRIEDAPPPPEVSDVTDVVADSLEARTGLWSPAYRVGLGAAAVALLSAEAALLFATPEPATATPWLIGVWAGAVLVALVFGLRTVRWLAIGATAVAIGVSGVLGWVLLGGLSLPLGLGLGLALAWAALGLGIGVGLRARAIQLGAVVGVLATALPLVLVVAGVPVLGAMGITAVATVAVWGLIPWYAMSASGLTGLDDQVVGGATRRRTDVLVTVHSAYRSMSWSTAGLAVPAAVATAALLSSENLWAVGLGSAVVLVTALRTRAFPLAAQSVIVWSAALLPVLVAIFVHAGQATWLVAVPVGIAALTLLLIGVRPAAHQRARLRRLGNLLEALAVIALLPLLLGVFAVYADLLGTF